MITFRNHFAEVLSRTPQGGPLAEILTLLVADEKDPRTYRRVFSDYGVRHQDWFRKDLSNLLIGIVEAILQDGPITATDQLQLDQLKECLSLRSGDLAKYEPHAVATLLDSQVEMLLEDSEIDPSEDLYQVELQRALDLGYDEYLAFVWPVMDRVMNRLMSDLARVQEMDGPQEGRLMRKIAMLEPHYRLAAATHRG